MAMTLKKAVLASCAGLAVAQTGKYPTGEEMSALWTQFKSVYPAAVADWDAFESNIKQAVDMNAEQGVTCTDLFNGPDCVFGITKFSGMPQKDFEASHMGYKRSAERQDAEVLDLDALRAALKDAPDAVDWRKKGAVTPVKDQGDCGSCWAFSATEEIESSVFMATGKLPVPLSTQQIISCDKSDDGCDGGDTTTAYQYVKKAGGLDSAKDYPDKSSTTGRTGKCKKKTEVDAKVSGFSYAVKPCDSGACKNQDESGLAVALASKGPISICVNAAGNGWQNYMRGIYSKKCSGAASQLDHCVQLVGYDKTGATPYWIVRNSWAADWGIDGYMHLEMGKNLCGVADEATLVSATAMEGTVTV